MSWAPPKYEYISVPVTWIPQDVAELMKYANEGWRLLTILNIKGSYPHAIFERVKP